MSRKKKKGRRGDGFLERKRKYTSDSWDFDNQQLSDIRTNSQIELTIGDKIETGIHNVGELVEEKTNKLNKNRKNLRNIHKMDASNAVDIVDKLIPQRIIQWSIRFIIGIYGFIGIISITLLIFYCLDYFISTIYSTYSSYDYIFLYIMITLCSIGAIIGLYGTFKFGSIDEQIHILKQQNNKLSKVINNVRNDSDKLKESILAFENQVNSIIDNEHDLKSQIKAFQRLENELKLVSKSNNSEIIQFLRSIQKLFRQFKMLQIMVEKANLLNLFYELEFRYDDIHGLNKNEYQIFLSRLDDETASKFKLKTFQEMDRNNDGTIDLNEFQSELDKIYNRINVYNYNNNNNNNNNNDNRSKYNDWQKWLK